MNLKGLAKGAMTLRGLTEWCGIAEAVRLTTLSNTTLRTYADIGRIRSVRDPVGRRLLRRVDVERIAAEHRVGSLHFTDKTAVRS